MHFQMLHIFSMFLRHPFLIYASQIENKCMEHRFWYKTLARSISLYFITTMRPFTMTTKALLSHYLRTRFIVIWCKRRRRRRIYTRWFPNFCFWCFCMWICMNRGFNLWYSWDYFVVDYNLWGRAIDITFVPHWFECNCYHNFNNWKNQLKPKSDSTYHLLVIYILIVALLFHI